MNRRNRQNVQKPASSLSPLTGHSPERNLLASILAKAILGRSKPYRENLSKADVQALEAWFRSDEVYISPEEGISYAYICLELDLDPVRVRQEVLGNRIKLSLLTGKGAESRGSRLSKALFRELKAEFRKAAA